MIKIIIDGRPIVTEAGMNLLQACLDNNIYIPNLCFLKEMEVPPASCRLCFVQIEGMDKPVTACSVTVKDGMRVHTGTERVRELQKTVFELLMSNHKIKCAECLSKDRCVLLTIGRFLKIKLKSTGLESIVEDHEAEDHPYLIFDQSKCILCGKCVYICEKLHGCQYLSFARRGLGTNISFFGENDRNKIPCGSCNACVEICPVSALMSYKKYRDVVN